MAQSSRESKELGRLNQDIKLSGSPVNTLRQNLNCHPLPGEERRRESRTLFRELLRELHLFPEMIIKLESDKIKHLES